MARCCRKIKKISGEKIDLASVWFCISRNTYIQYIDWNFVFNIIPFDIFNKVITNHDLLWPQD